VQNNPGVSIPLTYVKLSSVFRTVTTRARIRLFCFFLPRDARCTKRGIVTVSCPSVRLCVSNLNETEAQMTQL